MNTPPPYSYTEPHLNNDVDDEDDYNYSFEKPKLPVPSTKFEESFSVDYPKYNDTFFTYTFILTIIIFTYISYKSFHDILNNPLIFTTIDSSKKENSSNSLYYLIAVSTISPFVCAISLLFLAYSFPSVFVFLGFLLIPISLFSISFSCLVIGNIFPAILFGAFGFFSVLFLFQNYNKLSFTALMFKIIVNVMKNYPSSIFVSFLSSIFSTFVSVIYLVQFVAIYFNRLNKDDKNCPHSNGNDVCISNTSLSIMVFAAFAGYYIFEVIENTTHVTVSGIFGSWYFFNNSTVKPRNPAWGSFKRAVTYCFGSICFGSLLVSVVKTTRLVITTIKSKLRSNNDNDDSSNSNDFLICFLICILSVLEWFTDQLQYWMKWFNRYAYSYLALYGKDYLSSAKDTFEILRFKGMLILISDCLMESTLNFYAILVMIVNSGFYYLLYAMTDIFHNLSNEILVIGFVAQLLISWFVVSIALNSISSGFITFLVALSIKPEIFEESYPNEFMEMERYYPEIRQKLDLSFPNN